ncbi:Hypothetical protein IALB_1586 [Ignavibacterium album JCM 16511]|uniref:Yip1 domain-containing protein n=1 Tax=Ignavibacterium album (strain DSM 19864 / JCM 16511 / NBRC 101810 / Mat9-16) TaxID=945713 RepID=I0AJY7_IGNAJ|nr:YIP1 family protein [Ignavibacterium album]AFH49294.1 Hypothetical protein IALB_1586 [Ignavibacterium album JCM 16511]
MSYRNEIPCSNCGSLNFDFEYKCKNCKSFLRERIVNIDLGETLLRLIDSPSEAFYKIKFSEHKNYVLFIALLLSIRFLIISRFISVPFVHNEIELSLLLSLGISILLTFIVLMLISFISSKIFALKKIKTRFRDIFSVITYSFVPSLLSIFILFPIELVFYGEYLFSNNPYPYQIKESIFYFLLILEILMILWSIFLLTIGLNVFLKSRFLSFILSISIWIIILVALFIQSKIFLIH